MYYIEYDYNPLSSEKLFFPPTHSFPFKRKLVVSWWIAIFYIFEPTGVHATVFLFWSFDLNLCSYIKCLVCQSWLNATDGSCHRWTGFKWHFLRSVLAGVTDIRRPMQRHKWMECIVYKCKYCWGIRTASANKRQYRTCMHAHYGRCTETKPFLTCIGHYALSTVQL